MELQLNFKGNILYFHICSDNLSLEEQIFDLFNCNLMIRKYIEFSYESF